MTRALFDLDGRVAVADLDTTAATETVTQIQGLGRRTCAVSCNVAKPDDMAHLFYQVDKELGPVEILVNNAGLGSQIRTRGLQAVINNPPFDSSPLIARFLKGGNLALNAGGSHTW